MPASKYQVIAADIADYLSSLGFQFYRSDRVGFPNRPLEPEEVRMFKALAQLYPYLQKHIASTSGTGDLATNRITGEFDSP